MLPWLTTVVLAAAALLGVAAAYYAVRGRQLDDRLLVVLGVLEVALLVQVVVGIAQGATTSHDIEKPVFFAYLVTVPFVAPAGSFMALKEKTRWAMGVVVGSALVVAILVGRLVQVWNAHA